MRKYKNITTFFILPLAISLVVANFSSCSYSNKIDYEKILGDIDKIEGGQSGESGYYWSAFYNGSNMTQQAKWFVLDNKYSFEFYLNSATNKICFSWKNLSYGVHTFQLVAKAFINETCINFLSETIFLCIKKNPSISGGNTDIVSFSTNYEHRPWRVIYDNVDYSSSAKWSITKLAYQDKIKVSYSHAENGAILSWEKLNPATYNFQIIAKFIDIHDVPITSISLPIKLVIYPSINCVNGRTSIFGQKTGSDDLGWQVFYNGTNYAKIARWWVDIDKNISVHYDSNSDGAIVSWSQLDIKKYKFKVHCEFDVNGTTIFGISPEITLSILDSGEILGGSLILSGQQTGYDSNFWHFYYNNDDHTKDAEFTLITKKNDSGLFIMYNEIHNGIRVYWKNLAIENQEFIIRCKYTLPDGTIIVTETPNILLHINMSNIFGGSTEVWADASGGVDKSSWYVFYRGVDYTFDINTSWSLCDVGEPKISFLKYFKIDHSKQTINIQWDDITSSIWDHFDYSIKLKATFIDDTGQSHTIYSDTITFHFSKHYESDILVFNLPCTSDNCKIEAKSENCKFVDDFGWYASFDGLALNPKELHHYEIKTEGLHEGDHLYLNPFYDISNNMWYIGWTNAHFSSNYTFYFRLSLFQKRSQSNSSNNPKIVEFRYDKTVAFTWNGSTNND